MNTHEYEKIIFMKIRGPFMAILLVATLCKSGRAERVLKKRKAACGISISLKK